MLSSLGSVVLIVGVLLLASCADLPRDPKNTTRQIQELGRIRVGLIENPPWVIRNSDSEPGGAEVALVRQFAESMNAKPEWHWGGEEKLLPALEKYELDVVAGGLNDNTPWSKRVGLTSDYYNEPYYVGVWADGPELNDITGVKVAVGSDRRLAGIIREKKGVPDDTMPIPADTPVAAPTWKLSSLGLRPVGSVLHTDKHVLATPPGENRLIMRLDEFMSEKQNDIPELLQQQPEVAR